MNRMALIDVTPRNGLIFYDFDLGLLVLLFVVADTTRE